MSTRVLLAVVPMLLALTGVGGLVATLQARGLLTTKPLRAAGRLNPVANARRLFSVQSLAELVKSVAKLVIVGAAMYGTLRAAYPDVLATAQQSPVALLEVCRRYGVKLLMTAGLAYLALAALDYAWQLWRHEQRLRMTKDEVKRELKQTEGDPEVKARMRSVARGRTRPQPLGDVSRADVVIVGAALVVALEYEPDRAPAPVVIAAGRHASARRIERAARDGGVPVVEQEALARALGAVAPGQPIPAEHYEAAAAVLAQAIGQRALA